MLIRIVAAASSLLLVPALSHAEGRGESLRGHQLLVSMIRTGDTEIYVADLRTGDLRNVTRAPLSEERFGCWSPDGRRIAFASNRGGKGYDLFVADADGGNVKRLTAFEDAIVYMPSWEPTAAGERICFGLQREKGEIAMIDPEGGNLRIVGEGHDPALSPDGKRIAYAATVQSGAALFVMDLDGGQTQSNALRATGRQVVNEISAWGALFPAWSPDGKEIVYSHKVGRGIELFVAAADGGASPRQLTKLGGFSTPAAWSPDGKWISFRCTDEAYWRDGERMQKVYAERPANKRPVWVVRVDGTDAHVVESLRYQMGMDGSRAAWRRGRESVEAGGLKK